MRGCVGCVHTCRGWKHPSLSMVGVRRVRVCVCGGTRGVCVCMCVHTCINTPERHQAAGRPLATMPRLLAPALHHFSSCPTWKWSGKCRAKARSRFIAEDGFQSARFLGCIRHRTALADSRDTESKACWATSSPGGARQVRPGSTMWTPAWAPLLPSVPPGPRL